MSEPSLLEQLPWVRHGFGTRTSAPPDEPLATVKQVHSAVVLEARAAGNQGEGDALISNTGGLAIAVKTADCVPILLADSRKHAVAAVHAGWRGTVEEIVRVAIARMSAEYGTEPVDVTAEIGPAIGKCCFEVGPEVARQFSKWNAAFAGTNRKEHVDLAGVNCAQLCKAGVPAHQIQTFGLCTMCEAERFFSFRREREAAGRMWSWIRKV